MTPLAEGEREVRSSGAMKPLFSRRRVLVASAVILLALFFLRPGASRLKYRIASSISSAVGRPVEIGSVHLRLLPRPGFDLKNLVVYDDPAFGAEPMLRASEVTADLRLTSLVRGRMEIARLDLTEPSLNLVHGTNGRWNLEALLERTAHNPLAPTAKATTEARSGFPYIEGTSARINFKSGPEKKPYALTNADFSLWQDSENSWGVRLKAQPFRTDLNLNDTGTLQVNGTWQRAAVLRDTPLQFSMEWSRAQLGQLSKFFTGNDQGWRGGAQVDLALSGTPGKLQVAADASIQDFRRYDINSGQPLRLATHCDAQFSSMSQEFHDVMCNAPVGSGLITLKGDMNLSGSRSYGLVLMVTNVPTSAAVALALRAKKNLPEDVAAEGVVTGNFTIQHDAALAAVRVAGRGEFSQFRMASAASQASIGPGTIPFVLATGEGPANGASKPGHHKILTGMRFPDGERVEFGPFLLGAHASAASGTPPVARALPPTVRGWVTRFGYNFSVIGEGEIAKALRVTRMFGIPALQAAAQGTAQVNLQVTGPWAGPGNGTASGFPTPQVTGTARLRDVRVTLRGAGGPVDISSADVQLLPDEVRVDKLSATAAGTVWSGSLQMPRGCGTPGACEVHFDLNANQIGWSELSEWVNPRPKDRPWYRVLEPSAQSGTPFLPSLRASGRVNADRLVVRAFEALHISADASLNSGRLQVSNLTADFLGGKHRGEMVLDFSAKPAACSGKGSLTAVSLAPLSDAMNDQWIAGTANASYELKGTCAADFWGSAGGTLQFEMTDGALPHLSLGEDAGTLKVTKFSGKANLQDGKLELKDASLNSPDGKFQVSGTASLQRELDLKLLRLPNSSLAAGYAVTGTLAEPRVIRLAGAETQAQLKP
jgi:hypothetical protein